MHFAPRSRFASSGCRKPALALAGLLFAATLCPAQQDSLRSSTSGDPRHKVLEVYVPPALPWEGPLPSLRLDVLATWSLVGEPLGTPSWADSSTLVLAAREPEMGRERLLAYRVGTGEGIWALPAPEPVALPPVGGAGQMFVAYASGVVEAVSAADGASVWSTAPSGRAPSALAFLEHKLLVAQGSTLSVLDASEGSELFSVRTDSPAVLPPQSCGGRWFISLSAGEVLALDPEDGAPLWTRRLEGLPTPPACEGKLLVVGTSAHRVVGLRARSGRRKWSQRLAGAIKVPPLLFEGGVYAGALDGRIYGFKKDGGHRLWAVPVGERVRRDPVLVRGLLGVASGGETLLSFVHLPTGRILLEAEAPQETAGWIGSPAVHGDRLALALDRRDSPDGALIVYQLVPVSEDSSPEAGQTQPLRALKD